MVNLYLLKHNFIILVHQQFTFSGQYMKNFLSKVRLQSFLMGFALVFIISAGCSHNPIKTNLFTGFQEIEKGENATIRWDFEYADRVRIDGIDALFDSSDSLTVSPDETKRYLITAYQGNVDSVQMSARVIVIDDDKDIEEVEISEETTDYFIGIKPMEGETSVHKTKVMRMARHGDDGNIKIHSILIDNNGNFIRGAASESDAKWWIELTCGESSFRYNVQQAKEYNNNNPNGIDISLLLDNSASSGPNAEIIKSIEKMIPIMHDNDRLQLSGFNQEHFNVFDYSTAKEAQWQLNNLSFPAPNGLNAPYKAVYKELNKIMKMPDRKRIMVLVVFNADNSSIIYEPNDVVNMAYNANTPIYVIAMGDAVVTYSFKYIASMTGGRFYNLEEEDFDHFPEVLSEIILSQKYYYEYELPVNQVKSECSKANATFFFSNDISRDQDDLTIYLTPERQYSQYQAVVSFDFQSNNVSSTYLNTVRSLAVVLKDNPEMKIELIGNSSNEGDPDFNLMLSEQRAETVKTLLVSYGARANQIITKGLGRSKPIYYMENFDWHSAFNRRVEIRWLDPSLLPYEIVTEFSKTETEAEEISRKWEDRGYRSYYDRYIVENYLVYRVKIWGFATSEEAESEAVKLSNQYEGYFSVE